MARRRAPLLALALSVAMGLPTLALADASPSPSAGAIPPPPAPPAAPAMPPPAAEKTLRTDDGKVTVAIEPLKLQLLPPETSPVPGAAAKKSEDEVDYTTPRFEPAGLPLLGGDTDIGFQFGVVGTLSHFANGIQPYDWNMDLVLSASAKDGPHGVQLVQENILYNADLPGYLGGKLRLNPMVQYQRTINMGYFGLGDAASGTVPANYTGPSGRYFEWIDSYASAYFQPRYTLKGPVSITGALGYRYMDPTAYADSKLERDAISKERDGTPVARGLQPISMTQLAVGAIYDSRDNEIFTKSGVFGQVGVAYWQGIPTSADVHYGEAEALIQGYKTIGPFVLAGRLLTDFQFDNVPFFDLIEDGVFNQNDGIGGSSGVRGVPVGRYAGKIKVIGNVELRSMFLKFHLFKQKISVGADALFDTGRSWVNYSFDSPLDGGGVGLKYGVGGGIYCLWGQAAIFRIDAAYSPDAQAENPSFPVGLYVADGTMF